MNVGAYKYLSPFFHVYTCLSLAVWTQPMGGPVMGTPDSVADIREHPSRHHPHPPILTGLESAHPLDLQAGAVGSVGLPAWLKIQQNTRDLLIPDC